MYKILYILTGPKGSGKTSIGRLVHRHTDIQFLPVEPIWLKLAEGENGWRKVEQEVDSLFRSHNKVMIESLGAGEGFRGMLAGLKRKYEIRMIKIETELSECLNRVRSRDLQNHIPVSDDQVAAYNDIAAGVVYDWYAVIDNNRPVEIGVVLDIFKDGQTGSAIENSVRYK